MNHLVLHWWNNVLGYHKLNVEASKFMNEADRGVGLAVSGENDSRHLDQIDGAQETDTGRVAVANHRMSYWCGAWDNSSGTAPKDDDDQPAGYFEEGPNDESGELDGFESVDEGQEEC
jgi:hypothetical protein